MQYLFLYMLDSICKYLQRKFVSTIYEKYLSVAFLSFLHLVLVQGDLINVLGSPIKWKRLCRTSILSFLNVWQNSPRKLSGPEVFFARKYFNHEFHVLNRHGIQTTYSWLIPKYEILRTLTKQVQSLCHEYCKTLMKEILKGLINGETHYVLGLED